MHFSKKIISAVAAVAMVLTSFSAFTVASAAEGEVPTVTMNFKNSNTSIPGTDAGVEFVLNTPAGISQFSFSIEIPQKYIQLYDVSEGDVFDITGGDDIIDCMFKAPRGSSFAKSTKFATLQGDASGDLVRYKIDLTANASMPFSDGSSFEIDFVLGDKKWSEAPVGSFMVHEPLLLYWVGGNDPIEGTKLVNNAEVKAPAATGTPSIGGTDKNAVENFAGYADAANLGVYTNPDLATDKAVAFKTTVTGTTATGDVVWKVTSNGVSKYHKMSIGSKLTGGGEAVIGLAVEGLDDSAATAGVAFLQ